MSLSPTAFVDVDVERLNDRLAVEHPIDDYYERSPFAIRFVERRRLATIRAFMGDVHGLDVAEVGSGGGHVLRMFPEARLTAIDVSDRYLAIARVNLAGYDVRFLKGEVDKLDLPAQGFHRVICTEVLEHVPAPAAFLLQLRSKVRAGGALCLTTPNGDYLMARLPSYGGAPQSTIDEAEPNSMDGDAHRYLYTREELVALVRGAGMRLEQHGFFLPAWLEGHLKTRQLHRLHYRWRKQLLRVPPTLPESLGRRFCSSQYLVARV